MTIVDFERFYSMLMLGEIARACTPLRRYGVIEEELVFLVAQKRGIKDHRRLRVKMPFVSLT